MPDVVIHNHGTVITLTPMTDGAEQWLEENVHTEDWQHLGHAIACEPRTVSPIIDALLEQGFTVTAE